MYITSKFICFYSNLFGLEKKIRIPYSHIKNVTKENTAMVIPNAIAISTGRYSSVNYVLERVRFFCTRSSRKPLLDR